MKNLLKIIILILSLVFITSLIINKKDRKKSANSYIKDESGYIVPNKIKPKKEKSVIINKKRPNLLKRISDNFKTNDELKNKNEKEEKKSNINSKEIQEKSNILNKKDRSIKSDEENKEPLEALKTETAEINNTSSVIDPALEEIKKNPNSAAYEAIKDSLDIDPQEETIDLLPDSLVVCFTFKEYCIPDSLYKNRSVSMFTCISRYKDCDKDPEYIFKDYSEVEAEIERRTNLSKKGIEI